MKTTSFILLVASLWTSVAQGETIGVSISKLDTFKTVLLQGMLEHSKSIPRLHIVNETADGVKDREIEILKKFVADKVDAVIVAPSDGDLGPQMTKIAQDAGVPLVYVNNFPSNQSELPSTQALVASNEKESGTLQAREVCRRLNGKGDVVVLMGQLFHAAARMRTEDIDEVFVSDACKGMRIVERQSAYWSTQFGEAQMQEWLRAGVHFDAVIANNDDMAIGAIKAIKASRGSLDGIVVAGVDATNDALAAIQAGDMQVTVLQSASGQGAMAIDVALKLAKGEKLPRENYVPFELVTPENLQSYLPKGQ
ncbi:MULTISPECIES: substrate-binding domain-containing protein [Rhizobium/Agrobacterium group]|uniref:substrate-binding domain-containing protein n=1 Tax=Rhizobium/Agrobacterium group TaxID=227290 RepID=UPI0015736A2A|nr:MULTISPECIES: substrate-binding domain-containing protein [Rhizobium/Agrobacterium group]NTD86786.1 sugar ABC transporter substrate-binding protein [Agrobacterium tumefaciens]NTD91513.1 sugar ABC transporter substrate-binding protein [Agrobacterium tumefaciens]NTD96983.1 sugar ABC transporter substrate-binding protein [Agrobacterium tumefaciens]NTE11885.1 sugar ABC transporter substrate-binding protein [Agrobacterium tumefaciens]NTE24782.1 sugar ABC transporter substrate-binding protein [Ag